MPWNIFLIVRLPFFNLWLCIEKPKCPLCEEIVVLDDLRTVLIVHYPPIGPGENVTFKLKKRRKFENTIYNAESFVEEEDFIKIQKIYYDEIKELKEGDKN